MQVERRTPAPEEGAEKGGEERVTVETQTVNSMKALWAKSKDEVSDDDTMSFASTSLTPGTTRSWSYR